MVEGRQRPQGVQEIKAFQWPVFVRTFVYVFIASALCIMIGYLVAYYVARFAGKRRGLYLTLLIAPFFISYLMRMLAWINLLGPSGAGDRALHQAAERHPRSLRTASAWLSGSASTHPRPGPGVRRTSPA